MSRQNANAHVACDYQIKRLSRQTRCECKRRCRREGRELAVGWQRLLLRHHLNLANWAIAVIRNFHIRFCSHSPSTDGCRSKARQRDTAAKPATDLSLMNSRRRS